MIINSSFLFGPGLVYFKQEKYDLAEYHFRAALKINAPSVVYCYLGMVLKASHRYAEALEALSNATWMDPKNPLAKLEKAEVLYIMGQYEESIADLQDLQVNHHKRKKKKEKR